MWTPAPTLGGGGGRAGIGGGEDAVSRKQAQEFRARLRVLREQDDPRLCSDIPCLALFVVYLTAVVALAGVAVALQEPDWLRAGWDYHARVCGLDSQMLLRPFLYWPDPEQLSLGLCVHRCPSIEDFERALKVTVPRAEPLLKRETGWGADLQISFSQAARLQEVHIYPTEPALGRFCLPAPETEIGLSPVVVAGVGPAGGVPRAKDTVLPALREAVGSADDQLRRAVGGLQQVWWTLASCVVLVPLVAGALPTVLASHRAALPAVWTLVLSVGIGSFGLGAHLLVYRFLCSSDVGVSTLNSLQLGLALLLGVCLIAVGVFLLLFGLVLHDELRWAAACAEAAVTTVRAEGLAAPLGLVSLSVAAAQGFISLGGLFLLECAASSAWLDWPAELPATTERDSEAPMDELAEVVPGGPLVRGLRRHPVFRWQMLPLLLLWVSVLRIALGFVAALGRGLVAYIMTRWYFSEPLTAAAPTWRRTGRRPVLDALAALAGAHLGGVAAAAAARAAVPSIGLRAAAVAVHKAAAPWQRGPGSIARGLGLVSGSLAAALGSGPETQVAMFAGHFHVGMVRSAKGGSKAIPAVQFLSSTPALLEAAACGFAWLIASGGVLLLRLWGQGHADVGYVEMQVAVAVLAGSLAVAPTSAWLLATVSGFDALLECFLCDDAHHQLTEESMPPPSGWAVSVDASYALWSSRHAPDGIRSLVFQAAQTVQQSMARGARRSAHSLKDVRSGYGYTPVGVGGPPGADED